MKKYYLLPLITLIFFVSKAQEVKIKKNNYELITVSKYQEIVDIEFTPVFSFLVITTQSSTAQLIKQINDSIKRIFFIYSNLLIPSQSFSESSILKSPL